MNWKMKVKGNMNKSIWVIDMAIFLLDKKEKEVPFSTIGTSEP